MDFAWLVPFVALLLILAAAVLALSGRFGGTRPGPKGKPSTLARDGGHGGVGFLIPVPERAAVKAMREKKGIRGRA